jgi:hypothetical protein
MKVLIHFIRSLWYMIEILVHSRGFSVHLSWFFMNMMKKMPHTMRFFVYLKETMSHLLRFPMHFMRLMVYVFGVVRILCAKSSRFCSIFYPIPSLLFCPIPSFPVGEGDLSMNHLPRFWGRLRGG